MLTRRRLSLSHPQALPDGPVLRLEVFEDSLLAGQLLAHARAQADTLLADAREEAERLRQAAQEQALAEVWQQADALLAQWQAQRQQMWDAILQSAESLLGQAWQRLLGEQGDAARIAALCRQLSAARPEDEPGVLHCHPDRLDLVANHLQQAQAVWSLRADPQQAPDSLCLRTEHGDFAIDWQALGSALGPLPDSAQP
ncbi:type III secretion system stator protein SctL [Pseudomonas sp. R16(2017)]|uniref:type III secretion system stator protein SctL n=1 Tax=Pseudomonas sp. R16(2017) TaxID=1981704 RepID=UPI000A20081E|nr:type III secretion system stator protein SctL [Pseudomonas sp. R16(2017)]